ncbi:MAG: HepT-like ribonuclease domain-containing protein [Sulfobacillus sp.]
MSRKTDGGDRGRPEDIVREADLLQSHVQGKSAIWLGQDPWAMRAVEHAIQIVAEAASHLSVEAQRRGADLPWRQMAGMRIVLTHR